MIAFKVMGYKDGWIFSLMDPSRRFPARHGLEIFMPDKGIYLGFPERFVRDHYVGLTDEKEVVVTFRFDPSDVTSSLPTDREGEITVSRATVVDWTFV